MIPCPVFEGSHVTHAHIAKQVSQMIQWRKTLLFPLQAEMMPPGYILEIFDFEEMYKCRSRHRLSNWKGNCTQ